MIRRAALARPYFFEVFTILNFVVIQWLLWNITRSPVQTLWSVLFIFVPVFAAEAAAGVAIRAIVAWRRGNLRTYLAVIRSPGWIVDSVRIVFFSAFCVQTYCWIKLAIPLLHPRLFDQELWNLDRAVFLGYSPNVFVLDLFSAPAALRAIDWTYANVFLASLALAVVYFASSPSRRVRVAFSDSSTAMWLIGAWLYVAVPSLGPAYRFPEVWQPLAAFLGRTQQSQRTLMTNYQMVLDFKRGILRPVNILFGIAAFPSLHVAFETLVFLWMRRLWRYGQIVFGIFLMFIVFGSIITGWHYVIDAFAGAALAWICYAVAVRAHRINRWLAIRRRVAAFFVACLH